MPNNEKPVKLTISNIFNSTEKYCIPIYQRAYAWGIIEITQLIQDIIDNMKNNIEQPIPYYIGTLVVCDKPDYYEVIDGQQRLITLTLLYSYLKNITEIEEKTKCNNLPLYFKIRESANIALKTIFRNNQNVDVTIDAKNQSIMAGYEYIKSNVGFLCVDNEVEKSALFKYLLENVVIIRVSVPNETDLNHYFEIMNTRGEQLEQHEILKARMMGELKKPNIFNEIWDACSDMNTYVLSNKNIREKYSDIIYNNSNIDIILGKKTDEGDAKISIDSIVNESLDDKGNENENSCEQDDNERFSAIINFPNFLMIVLKIFLKSDEIALNDKKLLSEFKKYLKFDDVEEFIKALLICRVLFDNYIIKYELICGKRKSRMKFFDVDEDCNDSNHYRNTFSVKDDNKWNTLTDHAQIVKLLSAYHVSYTSQTNKRWLYEALLYLKSSYSENKIDVEKYIGHMEQLAVKFLPESDFSFGKTNPFVFNFLDYLLWIQNEEQSGNNKDSNISNFEFTMRSSVEHLYPQNPSNAAQLNREVVDHFGNLCLINISENSSYSNKLPSGKHEHFKWKYNDKKMQMPSIKQYLMMKTMDNGGKWDSEQIKKHGEAMLKLLEEYHPVKQQ